MRKSFDPNGPKPKDDKTKSKKSGSSVYNIHKHTGPKFERRLVRIPVMVTYELYQIISEAAEMRGASRAEVIRSAIVNDKTIMRPRDK